MMNPMSFRRHLPGVGTHDGRIFVVGGANDAWEAQFVVEAFNPTDNRNVINVTQNGLQHFTLYFL